MGNFIKLTTTNYVAEEKEIHAVKKIKITVGKIDYEIQFNEAQEHLVITKNNFFLEDQFPVIKVQEIYTNVATIK